MGKLLKYDLRSCLRHMWPFWAAMAAMSLINGIIARFNFGGPSAGFLLKGFPVLLLVISVLVTIVVTLTYICNDFYNGLLGTPGYLMFTLPVKTSSLILSKCITAVILELFSFVVAGICGALLLGVMFANGAENTLQVVLTVIKTGKIPGTVWLLMAELLLMSLTLAASFNTHIYAASAIGQLFSRMRLPLSFLAYVLLGILSSQAVTHAATLISRVMPEFSVSFLFHSFQSALESLSSACKVIWLVIAVNFLLSAVYFLISWLILDKKLNLE